MGVNEQEQQKVQNLQYDEVYNRIKEYYSDFINKWNKMTNTEKEGYIFGNGRKAYVEYVNKSETYLTNLPTIPSLEDSIDLAKNVIYKNLEYCYHDKDKYGIKMGAYAHYVINNFNGGKL